METLQRTANRGSISTGYNIENSSVWESDLQDQAYVTQGGTAGTRTKHTWSMWIKRTELGTRQMLFEGGTSNSVTTQLSLSFQTTDALEVRAGEYVNGSTAGTVYRLTNRVFRDTAAWYHIVAAFDTTQGTANDRIKIWVNGVQETSFATTANPSQNSDLGLFAANAQSSIGVSANNAFHVNGYIAHPALVYNAQLNADSFGEFDEDSGIWKPIDLEDVTFGTYGYWMKNEIKNGAGSGMATDSSGNSKTFANWDDTIYQSTDTPTNNFAVGNPFISAGGYFVTTNGNTKFVLGTAGPGNNIGGVSCLSTIAASKGKWYMEMKNDLANDSVDSYARFGFVDVGTLENGGVDGKVIARPGSAGGAYFGGTGGGRYHYNNTAQGSSTAWIRQIMGMALDLDNKKVYFHIDGTYTNSGDPANGTDNAGQYEMNTGGDGIYVDETWVLGASAYNLGIFLMNWGGHTVMPISSAATDANGYGTFEYAPPSGYYALCTKNLEEFG
jgi:hypothetical protein